MKSKEDYTTSFTVEKPASEVFRAIADFRSWWSEQIQGSSDKLNDVFLYHYKEVHICKLKLVERIEDERLVYTVLDNHFSFTTDPREWIDTQLVFELSSENGKTTVTFTHQGLTAEHECYAVCHDAWTSYIQGSLQSLLVTGKGKPNPAEGGLNAELIEKWGLPVK